MGVGWIDDIYNNTGSSWYLSSADSSHNGSLTGGGDTFTLDDRNYHEPKGNTHYHASWCGLPWYYQGLHYKAFSSDRLNSVQFFASEVDGNNWIYYTDGRHGNTLARQQIPKIDFHCRLRFEDDGPYIDVVNDDGSTQDVIAFVYTEVKAWTQIMATVLAGLLRTSALPH